MDHGDKNIFTFLYYSDMNNLIILEITCQKNKAIILNVLKNIGDLKYLNY